jgi:hypothetical protein
MNIVDSPTWTTPVPLIDDGDPLSNAEFLATAQALANRTAYLATLVAGAGANKQFSVRLDPIINSSSAFTLTLSSQHFWYEHTVASGVGALYFPLEFLPAGIKLVSATMRYAGAREALGAHGTLPATMPLIAVHYQDDLNDTQIASQSDPSGSVAVYDLVHDVTVVCNHTIVGPPRNYYIRIAGENGGTLGTASPALYNVSITLGP